MKRSKEKLNKQLVDFVKGGDAASVRELLTKKIKNIDIEYNSREDHFFTPLMMAAGQGNTEIAGILIDNQADVNASHYDQMTALMYAVTGGYTPMVELMVNNGADLNRIAKDGNTVLSLAILKDDHQLVNFLINKGADVNAEGAEEIAKVNRKPGIQSGVQKAIQSITAGGPEFSVKKFMNTFNLFIAAANSGDVFYKPPLWLAIEKSNADLAEVLIKHGADINWMLKTDVDTGIYGSGTTGLMYAASKGNIDIIKLIVDAGADLNARVEYSKRNALYYAISGRSVETVKLLLDAGVDTRVQDSDTALMAAVEWSGGDEIVKTLIEKGADLNERNEYGSTALMKAVSNNANINIVKFMISKGADADARGDDGSNALMDCYRNPEMIQILNNHGADINTRKNNGETPLYAAVSSGDFESTKLLIELGADLNSVETDTGQTPLMNSIYKTRHYEITMLLLDHGADATIKDKKGKTALQYAEEKRDVPVELVEKLKQ